MTRYHTIVLGLGAMGSAALYQLSKRGHAVLGIDQYAPPHTLGSSHGDTRITRLAIGEGAAYTPFALRSHEIWRELEAATGEDLLTITGGLVIGSATKSGFFHGNPEFVQQTVQSAQDYDIAHEVLDSHEIRRRFPQFLVRDGDHGYYEEQSGFLRPENCVRTQLQLARDQGAEIRVQEKVLGWEPMGSGVQVFTATASYFADRLILSAGPWVTDLMAHRLEPIFKVHRQILYWFNVEDTSAFARGRFPVYIWDCGDEASGGIYGFPAIDGPGGGLKIATEQYVDLTTPDAMERTVSDGEKELMFERYVEPYLRGVRRECLRAVACPYTVTPQSQFIIAPHPESPQVIVASPCSGHGFKHSAAIGEALAELAVDGTCRLDISSFGWPAIPS